MSLCCFKRILIIEIATASQAARQGLAVLMASAVSWFGSDERLRRHVGATYKGTVTFFIFFNRATAHTREPIFAHNSSKDAVWCEEDPFWDEKCVILKFGGALP